MELKGITCRIPLELHNRISEEIREMGSTMGQFIEMIIREHYEKGEKKMMEKGVYVVAFSYPVVPKGKARIRTQVCASHTKEDIDFIIKCFKETREEIGK